MGMPRKGSRRIVVEEQKFLWRFEGRRRYHGNAYSHGMLTVQKDVERPGRVMQIRLLVKDWDPNEAEYIPNKNTLFPKDVENVIRTALEKGWDPEEKGIAWKECGSLDLQNYRTVEKTDTLYF